MSHKPQKIFYKTSSKFHCRSTRRALEALLQVFRALAVSRTCHWRFTRRGKQNGVRRSPPGLCDAGRRVDDRAVALRCCQDRHHSNRTELLSSASWTWLQTDQQLRNRTPCLQSAFRRKASYESWQSQDTLKQLRSYICESVSPRYALHASPLRNSRPTRRATWR